MKKSFFNKFLEREPYYHLIFWCLVLLYPYLKFSETGYSESFLHELNSLFFKISISYFLYLFIFPKKEKKWFLVLGILALIITSILYQKADSLFHPKDCCGSFLKQFASNFLTHLSFGAVFYGLFIFKKSLQKQLTINALTNKNQKAELDSLKAQVNPHFLFNTLNTIYARAVKTDEITAELILKLSNGFRYFLHEGQQDRVTLVKEISHLQDYIDLQKERLQNKVVVNFITKINNENQHISPLLFIPFVENAFKYSSILKGNRHSISIILEEKNNIVQFVCSNSFNKVSKEEKDDWMNSGIGISNTTKRLELLYPNKHQLTIDQQNSIFTVTLNIQL